MARRPIALVLSIVASTIILSCCNPSSDAASNLTISPPALLKVGALLDMASCTGITAMHAMQLAVSGVNQQQQQSRGMSPPLPQLQLLIMDTHCNPVQCAAAAVELFMQDVVAIAGPMSSTATKFAAHMAGFTHVPVVSFAATDPTLSGGQYPMLVRVAHNDELQMAAVARLVDAYGWTDVRALHCDDDYGANGIDALRRELQDLGLLILQQTAFSCGRNAEFVSVLSQLHATDTRAFVVHMPGFSGLKVLSEASGLGMMSSGYAWIVTDSITTTLATMLDNPDVVRFSQGVVGILPHISHSPELQHLLAEWTAIPHCASLAHKSASFFNAYGLYAYDTILLISYSINRYMEKRGDFQFADDIRFPTDAGGGSDFSRLKRFKGGLALKEEMLQMHFNGTTGVVRFNERQDRMEESGFDIVNMMEKGLYRVGYLKSGYGGILVASTDCDKRGDIMPNQYVKKLENIVWPGGSKIAPGGVLHIGVPWKLGFSSLVEVLKSTANNGTAVGGFCIDVFVAALQYLPYNFTLKFSPIGNGLSNPNYDNVIDQILQKKLDAIVGDVAVTTQRLKIADFTEPYTESGLVVLVLPKRKSETWLFAMPFERNMWLVTFIWVFFGCTFVWVLEHRYRIEEEGPGGNSNSTDTIQINQGKNIKSEMHDNIWYSISSLLFPESGNVVTWEAQIVIAVWVIVAFVIQSSYTANLASILTTEQPEVTGIGSLIKSGFPIGYQEGSFVKDYLMQLNVAANRLIPLSNRTMYAEALKRWPHRGGVAAVVDERTYINLFLVQHCDFAIAGPEFVTTGWGYAFPKGSKLAPQISRAIVNMSGNGVLQKISDFWIRGSRCSGGSDVGLQRSNVLSSPSIDAGKFKGFFFVWGGTIVFCLVGYIINSYHMFRRHAATSDASFVKHFNEFCKAWL